MKTAVPPGAERAEVSGGQPQDFRSFKDSLDYKELSTKVLPTVSVTEPVVPSCRI